MYETVENTMTPTSLAALLKTNEIIHPTSVRELRISDGTVVMELDGYPWWLSSEEAKAIKESSATIEYAAVTRAKLTESCTVSNTFDEDLEDFRIIDLTKTGWNQGYSAEIFCSRPVDDPIAVLTALDCFLTDNQCPFDRSEFLHRGDSIGAFIGLCKLSMFQIAKGPRAVCEIVSEVLQKQGVRHSITQSDNSFATGHLVQWYDGYLICEDARIYWAPTKA